MNRQQIFDRVNNIIIDKLNSGVIPWLNPMAGRMPANYISKHFYQGTNWLLLNHLDFKSPYYLTFLQAKQKNGSILKGAQGVPVIFWKLLDGSPDEDGKTKKVPFMQISFVFNLSQTTLYDESKEKELLQQYPTAQKILSDIIANHNPVIEHNFRGKGFYRPSTHSICIPSIDQFSNPDSYYDVLFHELIHWTAKDLKRDSDTNYESSSYSFEELVAEIGSSYLCALSGINKIIDNQAAYIGGWLSKFENDTNLIVNASSQAKKAVNYLLNKSKEQEE